MQQRTACAVVQPGRQARLSTAFVQLMCFEAFPYFTRQQGHVIRYLEEFQLELTAHVLADPRFQISCSSLGVNKVALVYATTPRNFHFKLVNLSAKQPTRLQLNKAKRVCFTLKKALRHVRVPAISQCTTCLLALHLRRAQLR